MKSRKIKENVYLLGAVDWDRRLFDSLIPLPDGTSYNSYLIRGSEKTALLDAVDPAFTDTLIDQLEMVDRIDYIVSHHAEQDHSGAIPAVMKKYPSAMVLASEKGKDMLREHLGIPDERIRVVGDGENLSLGDKNLTFVYTPWVHWPETMVTYLHEDRILFTCDFFGSHIATTDMYVADQGRVYEAAKRYYAEIMMPFRKMISKNIEKIEKLRIDLIAPSHGPIYGNPEFIISAYRDWVSEKGRNTVVIPYISMHGSTRRMVEQLVSSLADRGVGAIQFEISSTDIGKLAIALVDATTLVVGTPTVHVGAHPAIHYASYLANILKPKLKFASVIGSYGWNSRAIEQVAGLIPNLKVEILEPVLCKGYPGKEDLEKIDSLAEQIAERHGELGLM